MRMSFKPANMEALKRNMLYLAGMAVLLLLLHSCLPHKKIAKTYVETPPGYNFMLLRPDFLYKENLKEYEIENKDSLTEEQIDSVLFYNSIYLKEIKDAVFIDTLVDALAGRLRNLGFNIYLEEDMDRFMALQQPAYIVNIAQILLEEYVYPYEAEAVVYNEVVTVSDIDLNALGISVWFELNPVNTDQEAARVLFASDQVFDDMEGQFVGGIFGTDMQFQYTIDSLKVQEIYYAAHAVGRKYALYFNDYFLNRYILRNLPPGYDMEEYYHYNPKSGKIYPVAEEYRFIEMDAR